MSNYGQFRVTILVLIYVLWMKSRNESKNSVGDRVEIVSSIFIQNVKHDSDSSDF